MPTDSSVRITFLGGASSIGASCALIETDSANLVIDCGIRFQPGRELPDLSVLSGKRVDAVLLTHAHTDHSGALPVVCDALPGTRVYATAPTIGLVGILLRDALKLMRTAEREADSRCTPRSRSSAPWRPSGPWRSASRSTSSAPASPGCPQRTSSARP